MLAGRPGFDEHAQQTQRQRQADAEQPGPAGTGGRLAAHWRGLHLGFGETLGKTPLRVAECPAQRAAGLPGKRLQAHALGIDLEHQVDCRDALVEQHQVGLQRIAAKRHPALSERDFGALVQPAVEADLPGHANSRAPRRRTRRRLWDRRRRSPASPPAHPSGRA